MQYRRPVQRAFRNALKNTIGLVIASVATSASLLPFITSVFLPVPFGWVVGLWTSSLLLGVVLVGSFSLMDAIANRGVSLGTYYFWAGIESDWKGGLVIGVCTFFVTLVTAVLVDNPLAGVMRVSLTLFGTYLFCGWWVWVSFSLPMLARVDTLQAAFVRGGELLLSKPVAGLWLLVQALGLTLLSIPTIITPVILLPGMLMLLATQITKSLERP